MLRACLSASDTGFLDYLQGMVKSQDIPGILEQNLVLSVKRLGRGCRSRVFQEFNYPKQTHQKHKTYVQVSRVFFYRPVIQILLNINGRS